MYFQKSVIMITSSLFFISLILRKSMKMLVPIGLKQEHFDLVLKIPLFRDLPLHVKDRVMNELEYSAYEGSVDAIVARQNEKCAYMYILAKGKLDVSSINHVGNKIKIEYIQSPRAFATPHLFNGRHIFPATFMAVEDIVLIKITKDSIFDLMSSEPELLKSFLNISGNCNKCMVDRIDILSQKGVRSRFVHYLFNHKIDMDNALLEHNQTQLAEYLSVTRPALSKEINKMIKEKLIEISDQNVKLLDVKILMRSL